MVVLGRCCNVPKTVFLDPSFASLSIVAFKKITSLRTQSADPVFASSKDLQVLSSASVKVLQVLRSTSFKVLQLLRYASHDGFASFKGPNSVTTVGRPKSTVGTPAYITHEVLSRREYEGKVLQDVGDDPALPHTKSVCCVQRGHGHVVLFFREAEEFSVVRKQPCFKVDSKNLLDRVSAQSVGSSNTDVLDSPCLLVLITRTSQS
ncbi:hypothetical protein Tco_1578173 [Tanacetum coccineum]